MRESHFERSSSVGRRNPIDSVLLILLAALVLAWSGTPVARRAAHHTGFLDLPGARKIHPSPIPLLGGLAIYAGFLAAVLLLGQRSVVSQLLGILAGVTLVAVAGAWDDRRGLSPLLKLSLQILAGLLLVSTGVGVLLFHQPWADTLVTLFWVVSITNALNFLDNMDGLAAGVAAICSALFLVLAAMNDQVLVGTLAAALLGASLGFLVYNFNRASIFMGDSGSMLLGFILAVLGIKLRFPHNEPLVTWMVPVIVLGLPIFDTTLVVLSRLGRRVAVYVGDRDHLSHRLVGAGLSPREAVMALYILSLILGVVAIYITQANRLEAYVIAGGLALAFVLGLWQAGSRLGVKQ